MDTPLNTGIDLPLPPPPPVLSGGRLGAIIALYVSHHGIWFKTGVFCEER